ncbi:hypothetical protein AB0B25_07830 [Nocardia sp. NPDC049190]|uniref:hypothetical protein n=1 Tax=Nocardia sp. NPDC049190 TaxID=3155650 RepID=UPI0033FD1451
MAAAVEANALGMLTFALTGPTGNALAEVCDEVVAVDAPTTSTIQECHLLIAHELCAAIDAAIADNAPAPGAARADAGVASPPNRARHLMVSDVLADGEMPDKNPPSPRNLVTTVLLVVELFLLLIRSRGRVNDLRSARSGGER